VNCPATAEFTIACFAAPRHAVFLISELPSNDNLALAKVLAPPLQDHLARAVAAVRMWFHRLS
jgi:hypothetical protein